MKRFMILRGRFLKNLNSNNSPDYVDFALPLPFLSLAAYTCSGDFETKFSPEAVKKRKRLN